METVIILLMALLVLDAAAWRWGCDQPGAGLVGAIAAWRTPAHETARTAAAPGPAGIGELTASV